MPLYSPATHLHGFCSVPVLQNKYNNSETLVEGPFHNLIGAFRRKAVYNDDEKMGNLLHQLVDFVLAEFGGRKRSEIEIRED